jgi:hypothetical protein
MIKLIIDMENRKYEVSDLTVDEERVVAADVTARLASLQRRWGQSGDLRALLGWLIFCQLQLPERLFKGLRQNLEQQSKKPDEQRFLSVRYAHDVLGKTIEDSYDWARRLRLRTTPQHCQGAQG